MVREKEFFKRRAARQGRLQVLVAKTGLALARRAFRRAWRREGQLNASYSHAVEEYRQAQVDGKREPETIEALQQAFRRAKHAAKIQEGQRKKVELKLKEAEDKLENLIGPSKLLQLVQDALERGLPLPFTVSVQQGKATAHVTGERSSKSMKTWIRKGRRVRVELQNPTAASHPAMLRPFVVRGLKREPLPRRASSRTVHLAGIVASAFPSATLKAPTAGDAPATGLGKLEGTQASAIAGAGGAETADARYTVGKVEQRSYSSTLLLDREWLLPDARDQSVRAMPVLPPLRQKFTTTAELIHGSFPVQLAVKAAAVAAKRQQGRLERWQAKFDEDSPIYERLESLGRCCEACSISFVARSTSSYDLERGFDLSGKVARLRKGLRAFWLRSQELGVAAMTTGKLVAEGGESKSAAGHNVSRQELKKWLASSDREKVIDPIPT